MKIKYKQLNDARNVINTLAGLDLDADNKYAITKLLIAVKPELEFISDKYTEILKQHDIPFSTEEREEIMKKSKKAKQDYLMRDQAAGQMLNEFFEKEINIQIPKINIKELSKVKDVTPGMLAAIHWLGDDNDDNA